MSERREAISWVSLIRTARVPYGVLLLVGAGLVLPPQMRDMLAALTEAPYAWQVAAFPASIAVLGFLCWYWARAAVAARFDLPDDDAAWAAAVAAGERGARPSLRALPLLAVPQGPIPLAGVIGLLMAWQSGAWLLGGATLVLLLLVWLGVGRRRAVHRVLRRALGLGPAREPGMGDEEDRRLQATGRVRVWLARVPFRVRTLLIRAPSGPAPALALLALSLSVFAVTAAASLFPAAGPGDLRLLIWTPFRGPTPVLLAAGLMVGPLAVLAFALDGLRLQVRLGGAPLGFSRPPVLSALLAVNLLVPQALELHRLRVAPGALPARPPLAEAWRQWRAQCGAGTRPVVVALSGGASRAALWGMAVLGALDRAAEGRAAAVFAVSTVSGGSLGAAGYLAARLGEPPARAGQAEGCRLDPRDAAAFGLFARRLGEADEIGPLLAGVVFSDIPRALVGWLPALSGADLTGGDRAAAIERAFESWAARAAAAAGIAPVRLDLPYLTFRRADLPLWFGNATDRDNGARALFSPVRPEAEGPFQGVRDVLETQGRDVPASTAVNATARFPYLEPPGRVAAGGRDVLTLIDGGYYDQSGLETAMEIADWLRRQGADPILVAASAGGYESGIGAARDDIVRCGGMRAAPAAPSRRLADILAPVVGLYETRAGHVDTLLRRARYDYCDAADPAFFHLALGARAGQPVPLNWVLSRPMAAHVWNSADDPAAARSDWIVRENLAELARFRLALTR